MENLILVVDDDDDLRESLCSLLEYEGYAVVQARDGRAALSLLMAPSRPSLILLDLMLPVMDGWEFRDRQQQDPELATIPVIVTTAVSRDYRLENRMGAADYLTKPLDVPRLLEAIRTFCS